MNEQFKDSEEYNIFNMLREIGAVHVSQVCSISNCPKYQREMELRFRTRGKDSKEKILTWRCTGYKCGTKKINVIMLLIKCWAAQLTIAKTRIIAGDNWSRNDVDGHIMSLSGNINYMLVT
ncbi:hypothetical protein BpHYR1_040470 [Brachionus plicatilis]|uniref:Uncharacterized protein n=1 Tax=Brachionus plicatilis TaxID=10195 RepID=A0A3M7REZ3_BRAPC|nr:hypothetical protein BpHYR1_040470 [Brachionus plicatilis]